jgi:rRNA maturation RNase YbeY
MMAGSIKIRNVHGSYKIGENGVKRIIQRVLKALKKDDIPDVEVVFLDDESIRPINREFRGKDRATDVLSFKLGRTEFGKKRPLGEIYISVDKARNNSRFYGKTLDEEIALYVIHGLLHLFGYDDERPCDKRRMSKKEKEMLEDICKIEALSIVSMPR